MWLRCLVIILFVASTVNVVFDTVYIYDALVINFGQLAWSHDTFEWSSDTSEYTGDQTVLMKGNWRMLCFCGILRYDADGHSYSVCHGTWSYGTAFTIVPGQPLTPFPGCHLCVCSIFLCVAGESHDREYVGHGNHYDMYYHEHV